MVRDIDGKILYGLPITENKFQTGSYLEQLEDYGLLRPSMLEALTKKETSPLVARSIGPNYRGRARVPKRCEA